MIAIYSKCTCCEEVDKLIEKDICVTCTLLSRQLETNDFEAIKRKKKQLKKTEKVQW